MKATLTVEQIETPTWDGNESAPGPWIAINGVDVFCEYKAATADDECYAVIGRKVASLVLGEDAVYGGTR